MTHIPRQLAAALAVGLACATAEATVITFDGTIDTTEAPYAPLLTHEDAVIQDGFYVATVSTKAGATTDDLVGLIVDGADPAVCFNLVCPSNNATNYLAAVNDGLPYMGTLDGSAFSISSFDASFVAAAGATVPATALLLRVYGFVDSTTSYFQDFLLPGPTANTLQFATYTFSSAFAARSYLEVDFYGYACDAGGSCNRTSDLAQFALDNISVTAVPEPASYALMALGLAGIAALRRRVAQA